MNPKFIFISLFLLSFYISHSQDINTIAGGVGDYGPATSAELYEPNNMAVDKNGNIYIADGGHNLLRKVTPSGIITTIAGIEGNGGSGPFDVPAVYCAIGRPVSVVIDPIGNIFVDDAGNFTIMEIDTMGIARFISNGFVNPTSLAIDSHNSLIVVDNGMGIIEKISPPYTSSSSYTVIAGNGSNIFGGHPATAMNLGSPTSVATDKYGNIYCTNGGGSIFAIIDTNGIYTTIPTTIAHISAICTDTSGHVYVSDNNNNVVEQINLAGVTTSYAGIPYTYSSYGFFPHDTLFSGDGGPATAAHMYNPQGITFDNAGNLYIADYGNNRIRKVNAAGIISTVAGSNNSSSAGYKGDGAAVISALLNTPGWLATDGSGNLYIADAGNNRVRKINSAGIISTVAGMDSAGYSGDGGPATAARISAPSSVAIDKKGNLFICDNTHNVIRKVSTTGIISTYAGDTAATAFRSYGHRADSTRFSSTGAIAVDKLGNLYLSTTANTILKVDTNQVLSVFAGTGIAGFSGDGAAATLARLSAPGSLVADIAGNIYFADANNYRIRKINTSGIITTIAGNGTTNYVAGAGAAANGLPFPVGLGLDNSGNLFIVANDQLLKLNSAGIISTYGGTGSGGFTGDGGPAINASIGFSYSPTNIVSDTSGNLFLPDRGSDRVREIYAVAVNIRATATTICSSTQPVTFSASVNAAPMYHISYHWFKNNSPVGIDSSGYTVSGLHNGDKITCNITNGPTGIPLASSPAISMVVLGYANPWIGISTGSNTALCAGTQVTIAQSFNFGGTTPVINWYKNNALVLQDSVTYTFTPSNGDSIYCQLISSELCASPDTVFSDPIQFAVSPVDTPAVAVSLSPGDTVCSGNAISCNANVTAGGRSPLLGWYVNGALQVWGTITFSFTPSNNDTISFLLVSSLQCVANDSAMSAPLVVSVTPRSLISSISISLSQDSVCYGGQVTCTPIPVNGGPSPAYNWYWNGNLQSSGPDYVFQPDINGQVYCTMSNDITCVVDTVVTSPAVNIAVIPLSTPYVTYTSSSNLTCAGTPVQCTATGGNGGMSPVYTWYLNGQPTDTGINFNFIPGNGDNLYCQLTSDATCISDTTATSPESTFTVDSMPAIAISTNPGPVVLRGDQEMYIANVTGGNSTVTYQWYVNGGLIAGATDGSYMTNSTGNWDSVYCVASVSNPCQATAKSNTLYSDAYHSMDLYPDPNNGDFIINGNDNNANSDLVTIQIYDMKGNRVYEQKSAFNIITFYTEINMHRRLPPGQYLLHMHYSTNNVVLRFTVDY